MKYPKWLFLFLASFIMIVPLAAVQLETINDVADHNGYCTNKTMVKPARNANRHQQTIHRYYQYEPWRYRSSTFRK